ncbi:hypothetical protein MBM_04540 [Drepanopeziza brunnea f. sp. 'multigermtubi' MB_m1]|uniref:Reverse transcriptase domain-containing protein n=1 Tax=Marssonina brunnea f. sp. multigermtubi (strain MB_m1) TaxID=1072389 RepID=K1X8F2_MARBU|nr:uncharacterized protein MBM_04540 [Drepanopeziza brunnea f. sp. 'multigermtubi' MB_m1]EKD16963.1 hypothetical protein MBM_04540 [Drepanopeziza brunnea f. sp. 'multigermtubi' MB_m1]
MLKLLFFNRDILFIYLETVFKGSDQAKVGLKRAENASCKLVDKARNRYVVGVVFSVRVRQSVAKNQTVSLSSSGTRTAARYYILRLRRKLGIGRWFDIGVKVSHCSHAIGSLKEHLSVHTLPPSIQGALKVPAVQVSKEFKGTDSWNAWEASLITATSEYRLKVHKECIAVKEQELKHLESLADDKAAETAKELTIKKVTESLGPSFSSTANKSNDYLRDETRTCSQLGVTWLRRSFGLGLMKHQNELAVKLSKLKLKEDTDTHMSNYGANDITRVVELAVAKALNKSGKAKSAPPKDRCQKVQPQAEQGQGWPQTKETPTKLREGRKRKWEWEEETKEELAGLDNQLASQSKQFRLNDLSSYPRTWFEKPVDIRAQWLLPHSKPEYLDSISSTQSDIFQGPNVFLPENIRQTLSLNGKFILHDKMRPQLVREAWLKLQRSIRTKFYFKDRPVNPSYIPQFHIKQDDWDPPKASDELESGLIEIKHALYKQINALPKLTPRHNPNLRDLKQYLTEKNYLVKITDKNLGLSVISLDWYKEQVAIHMSNTKAYTLLDFIPISLGKQLEEIYESPYLPASIKKYIRASTNDLPTFYVIPKVHKHPWASRPIIPSHSWITSRVAEVIDYALQPELPNFPSVLTSTQDFLTKIRKVDSFDGCWIVTGDVTAMYTNIDPFRAIDSIKTIIGRASKGIRKSDLTKMMEFVLLNNFFKCQDKIYQQRSAPTAKYNADNVAVASFIDELAACVPRPFQAYFRLIFKEWFDIGVKVLYCSYAIGSLKEYLFVHTLPFSIQIYKECIAIKEQELKHLESLADDKAAKTIKELTIKKVTELLGFFFSSTANKSNDYLKDKTLELAVAKALNKSSKAKSALPKSAKKSNLKPNKAKGSLKPKKP